MTSAARADVRPHPLVIARAHGCRLVDVDGHELIDFGLANGPLLLGHSPAEVVTAVQDQLRRGLMYGAQHALEAEVAELLVELVPCAERVVLNTTGSEAVHTALRLARAVTGRRLVVRFEGHYHGWLGDIAFAGPSNAPSDPAATPPLAAPPLTGGMSAARDVAVLHWNDPAGAERFLADRGDEVAAVILEPVPLAGLLLPEDGFLDALARLTRRAGGLLIFDEVVTGFRLGAGGAQSRFGVTPDLTVLGKAIGAGFPVSAVVGRADLLHATADGRVLHMGTFNGHPPSLAAARAALTAYRDADLHARLEQRTTWLAGALRDAAHDAGMPLRVHHVGALAATLVVDPGARIRSAAGLTAVDRARGAEFAAELARRGVFVPPRGTWMLSAAHGQEDLERAAEAAVAALRSIAERSGS